MSERERVYHRVTLIFSIAIVGFGLGILIGVLFTALGLARGFLAVRAMR